MWDVNIYLCVQYDAFSEGYRGDGMWIVKFETEK
jgi:hypothetical protein